MSILYYLGISQCHLQKETGYVWFARGALPTELLRHKSKARFELAAAPLTMALFVLLYVPLLCSKEGGIMSRNQDQSRRIAGPGGLGYPVYFC